MSSIKTWRKKFREYVKSHDSLSLQDTDGNDIDFDDGKPMWDESCVVSEVGAYVNVEVEMCGIVDQVETEVLANWMRLFAASMGVYHADVDVQMNKVDSMKDYSVIANMEIRKDPHKPKEVSYDDDEFWIVGDDTTGTYLLEEDRGYGGSEFETTDSPMMAMRFGSYDEAVNALCTQEQIMLWAGGTPYPSRVCPMKVNVKLSVTPAKG